ncbi:MAG: hypothetical protein HPY55_04025 [Firmicutes bacterium]|nr:hypothetical protein [Bacillota bacterium]
MNWSRAKTALIIAFLLLDTALGFQVWEQTRGAAREYGAITSADLRNVKARLESDGVRLACSLPRGPAPLPYLVLRPGAARAREVLDRLSVPKPGGVASLATLLDNGTVIYTRDVAAGGKPVTRNAAVQQARAFIDEYVGKSAGLELDYALASGDSWVVDFCARVDGRPLFSSHATVKVFPAGLAEARFVWYEPVGYSAQRRSIIPSTEAVVTAAVALGSSARGRSIVAVTLGYYSEPYDARQWESVPVWRVLFDDSREIYVNAHTGEVERPRGVGK